MKIVRVSATPLNIPVTIDVVGMNKQTSLSLCLTEIETDTGLVGHGMTAITEEEIIAAAVREVAGPALIGEDPMATERLWEKLYWLLSPRGQTGYASHTIAALDIALWDIKAKALGQPLWRLLGGARSKVPVYATFGFGFFERDQLAAAAKLWVSQGFQRLKMTVGNHALARRDEPRPLDEVIAEDVRRVAAVREAVGPDVKLYVDANCGLDLFHATELAHRIEPYGISFFEEPLTQNDVRQMAQLRARTSGSTPRRSTSQSTAAADATLSPVCELNRCRITSSRSAADAWASSWACRSARSSGAAAPRSTASATDPPRPGTASSVTPSSATRRKRTCDSSPSRATISDPLPAATRAPKPRPASARRCANSCLVSVVSPPR